MPELTITARTGRDAAEAYRRISDFARYPEYTDAVVEVLVHPERPDGLVSEWTVRFRNGLLHWVERDVFDRPRRIIDFEQLSGDFAEFRGRWRVEPDGDGAVITFDAGFDLGIPSLAALIDPVAATTLRSNILRILTGLLGEVSVPDEPPLGAGRA